MPDSVIPFKVSLKDDAGKEIDNTTINAPNSHIFTNLSAGKYTVTCISPEGYTLTTPNPSYYTLTDEEGALEVTIRLEDMALDS